MYNSNTALTGCTGGCLSINTAVNANSAYCKSVDSNLVGSHSEGNGIMISDNIISSIRISINC